MAETPENNRATSPSSSRPYSIASSNIETPRGSHVSLSNGDLGDLGNNQNTNTMLQTVDDQRQHRSAWGSALTPAAPLPQNLDDPFSIASTPDFVLSKPCEKGGTPLEKRRRMDQLDEDASTTPAKRQKVHYLQQSKSNPWNAVVASEEDGGPGLDDHRLAGNQCLTDSIVNIMCGFAAAHLPGAHFVSSLTLSAAARTATTDSNTLALASPSPSPSVQAEARIIREDQTILRLITVAHHRQTAVGHYVWAMADLRDRVVCTADSLADEAPGLSRVMQRTSLVGLNSLSSTSIPLSSSSPTSARRLSWSQVRLRCHQQTNDVDCGVHAIVTCLYVAAVGPRKVSSMIATAKAARATQMLTLGKGKHEGKKQKGKEKEEEEIPVTLQILGPSPFNSLLWRAIILAMLRNAPLWPILCELLPNLCLDDIDHDPLLYVQADFLIPTGTSTRKSFDVVQQELTRLMDIRAKCAARARALQSLLDELDAAVGQILAPLQRRERICRLASDLRLWKLEKAQVKLEEAVRLTKMAAVTLGVRTMRSSLLPANESLACVLDELRVLRRREVNRKSAVDFGHVRLRALELGQCREFLVGALARYREEEG